MKIALVSPLGAERFFEAGIFEEMDSILHREFCFLMEEMEWMPNLGLLAIASGLPEEIELEYIDEEYLSPEQREKFPDREDFDLVVFSLINAQASRAYLLSRGFRARGVPVAMGGIHPTALPDEVKEHCDYLLLGEGEEVFPRFVEDFSSGRALPVYRAETTVDLTLVKPPRFDLMKPYLDCYNRFPVQATRGCPRNCDFCFLPKLYGSKFRHKTPAQVVREIEILKGMTDDPFISFADENLFVDLPYARELVKAITPLNVVWEGYCDISVARDKELLKLLAPSGCATLLIGLESLRSDNLKTLTPWKERQIMQYREAVAKIQSCGVGVTGLFIVGFDSDDLGSFREIRDFARSTGLFDLEVSSLCPFPGTGLWEEMEKQGRILTRNWDRYTWIHVNFKPRGLKPDEIIEGLLWLFKEMASRPVLEARRNHFRRVFKEHFKRLGLSREQVLHKPGLPV